MADRIITVITEDGKKKQIEPEDANDHLNKLELTPSKFVKEVIRKLTPKKKKE